jgi:hypothetical protein
MTKKYSVSPTTATPASVTNAALYPARTTTYPASAVDNRSRLVRSVRKTVRRWLRRLLVVGAGSTNSRLIQKLLRNALPIARNAAFADQHGDIASIPRAGSRQGGHRGSASPWHGRHPPLRPASRTVPAAPDARASCSIAAHSNRVSSNQSLCFRETEFREQRQSLRNVPGSPKRP